MPENITTAWHCSVLEENTVYLISRKHVIAISIHDGAIRWLSSINRNLYHACSKTVGPDGETIIVVAGGQHDNVRTNSTLFYHVSNNSWTVGTYKMFICEARV